MNASVDGLLVLDKPGGLTSRGVLDLCQHWFPRKTRMGHTGTLDPLATGVLVVCLGEATRLVEYVQDMPKTYRAGLLLGAVSATNDADGEIVPVEVREPPLADVVARELQTFVGEISQAPPIYSAAHVGGRRAHELARKGREVSLAPRPVHIHSIVVHDYAYPRLEIEVHCGKGTYIRSLARDLGENLGCGALIQSLRRTRVGPFEESAAVPMSSEASQARARLLPIETAVSALPRLTLETDDLLRFCQGQRLPLAKFELAESACAVAIFDGSGRLSAIAVVERDRQLLKPEKVFHEKKTSQVREYVKAPPGS